MPSSPQENRTTSQCAFVENNRRCRRNAVKSQLCGAHLSMIESSLEQRVNPIADLVDRLFRGERIPKATVEQLASDAVSAVVGRRVTIDEIRNGMKTGDIEIDWEEVQARARNAYSDVSSRVRSPRMSPEERAQKEREKQEERARQAKAREQASHVSRARRILGYSAKEPLTKEQVKKRHRELARKHHPDQGGKLERMQEINWAVDILLGPG